VLFHDALDCVQAQPCSFLDSFGREEWFKDMWLNFSGDSWTVIPNLDYNATIVAKSFECVARLSRPWRR
jgi:hypothetical protein